MAALTKGRYTSQMDGQVEVNLVGVPLKANTIAFIGGILCVDATGFGVAATTATGLSAVGIVDRVQPDAAKGGVPGTKVDNTGGANGDLTVAVKRGVFKLNNSAAADAIAQANVLGPCYLVDDNTVALTDANGTRSYAGYVVQIDDSSVVGASNSGAGVWVALGKPLPNAGANDPTPERIQTGTATLVAGTVSVATAEITATSKIQVTCNTAAGTTGNQLAAPSASRVAGTPGTFVINAISTAGATVATDTSTVDWLVVG